MEKDKQSEDIKVIREMMEKSSKSFVLSGLALVFAGAFASLGGIYLYHLTTNQQLHEETSSEPIGILLKIALLVLVLSIAVITYFGWRKARARNQALFNKTTKRAVYNFLVPMLFGGVFCLLFLLRGEIEIAISGSLLFYGLALINVSKYSFKELYTLGIIEATLGLIAALNMDYGLLCWIVGFGGFHLLFGILFFIRYDFPKKKKA